MISTDTVKTDVESVIGITRDGHVAIVEMRRPPHNFFDVTMLTQMADAFEMLGADPSCRAIVLAAEGKSFCAGADFAKRAPGEARVPSSLLYAQAVRLFAAPKPVVAAVHGAAIGGGLGVAVVADFRVTCSEARFAANFARLGFHPGFGLTTTLPRLLGPQKASMLLLTGRRVSGDEAVALGLADLLVPQAEVRAEALKLARELAANAPLAVQDTRRTLRLGLADAVRSATDREAALQMQHYETADFAEGIAATATRREPVFVGR